MGGDVLVTSTATLEMGRFPEVTAVLAGCPTQAQWFAFAGEFRTLLATRRPYVLVVDAVALEVPPPLAVERDFVAALTERRVELGAYALGMAICVSSGLLRATVKAVLTAAAPRYPYVVLGNVEDGRTWVRHRLVTNFSAEAEGISTVEIVNKLLAES